MSYLTGYNYYSELSGHGTTGRREQFNFLIIKFYEICKFCFSLATLWESS